MYFNHILIDKYFFSPRKIPLPVPPILLGSLLVYSIYSNRDRDLNDLRVKERGRCDQELMAFGKCLEKHSDQFEACSDLLEAYKRCLQK